MKDFRDDSKRSDTAATTAEAPPGKAEDKPAVAASPEQPLDSQTPIPLTKEAFEGEPQSSVVVAAAKPAPGPDAATPAVSPTPAPTSKEPVSTETVASTPATKTPKPAAPSRVRRGLYVTGFAIHPAPVIWSVVIAYLLQPFAGMLVDDLPFTPPGIRTNVWGAEIYTSFAEILLAIATLFIIRRHLRSPFGFRWPSGRTYLGGAVVAGVLLGVALAAHYTLNLSAHTVPSDAIRPTQVNVLGMLLARGVVSSSADEIVFRGVLLTYLAARIPGRIGINRFEMNVAGIFVALLYCLCYSLDLVRYPFMIAGPELLMVFLFGVLAAYWVEKSRSLVAPIVGHGIGNAIQAIALLVISGMG